MVPRSTFQIEPITQLVSGGKEGGDGACDVALRATPADRMASNDAVPGLVDLLLGNDTRVEGRLEESRRDCVDVELVRASSIARVWSQRLQPALGHGVAG